MGSTRTARSIGLWYLMMLPAPLNLVYLSAHFLVPGDAAATAQRIIQGETVYRLCVLAGLFSNIIFLFLVLRLATLFAKVDRRQARLMIVLVSVSAAIGIANLVNDLAPLMLLSGAGYLAAFSQEQLGALVMGFLRLREAGFGLNSAFWGLWLFPFGVLVIKSGFMPRFIGWLLILGCAGYLIQSATALLWPSQVGMVFNATIPLVAPGELSAMAWFLIRGGRVPLLAGEAAAVRR